MDENEKPEHRRETKGWELDGKKQRVKLRWQENGSNESPQFIFQKIHLRSLNDRNKMVTEPTQVFVCFFRRELRMSEDKEAIGNPSVSKIISSPKLAGSLY